MRLAGQIVLNFLLAASAWFEIGALLFVPGEFNRGRVELVGMGALAGLVVANLSGLLWLSRNKLKVSLAQTIKAPSMLAWSTVNVGLGIILLFFVFSHSLQTAN